MNDSKINIVDLEENSKFCRLKKNETNSFFEPDEIPLADNKAGQTLLNALDHTQYHKIRRKNKQPKKNFHSRKDFLMVCILQKIAEFLQNHFFTIRKEIIKLLLFVLETLDSLFAVCPNEELLDVLRSNGTGVVCLALLNEEDIGELIKFGGELGA
ncbi:hypothetical protein BpHYR1_037026 [Brachionus plicatilis]|uniref:Uncharacterized protein n=1 Tax=Brachionus plicatilis TaxID=10195 RepID=A0A3M7SMQ7_BRAPC|nr:hypothetical protein BpHYR1_037026 [Brachionus plicatilis]